MAENATTGQEPHLRQGRSADPEPPASGGGHPPAAEQAGSRNLPNETSDSHSEKKQDSEKPDDQASNEEAEAEAKEQEQMIPTKRGVGLRLDQLDAFKRDLVDAERLLAVV